MVCGETLGAITPEPILSGRGTASGPLDERERLERAAEDGGTVAPEPVVEQCGVDPSEVGVVAEVAGVEAVGSEARVLADDAPLDPRTRHEQARRGAVVGPPAAVLLDPAAELGEGHQHDPL